MQLRRIVLALSLLLVALPTAPRAEPAMEPAMAPAMEPAMGAGEPVMAPAMAPAQPKDGGWKKYDYKNAPAKKKEVPSGTLVVVAYVVLWGVLLGYVVLLALRQRRLQADLDELRRELRRRDDAEEGADERSPGETSRE